jgi:hypothetical protein
MEEHFQGHLKSIRANLKQAVGPESERISLPATAQKSFFDAVSIVWLLELRILFQNAVKDENIGR